MRMTLSKFLSAVRQRTQLAFRRHLLLTNIGIYSTLSATGDFIEQKYEMYKRHGREYNLHRTMKMSVTGFPLGLICHYSYLTLDKLLPGRSLKTAIYKMLISQVVLSPIEILTFFGTMAVLEQSTKEMLTEELRTKSVRLYLAELLIWPPAQVINFFFLPLRYRVLYDGVMSLFYDTYASYLKHETSENHQK